MATESELNICNNIQRSDTIDPLMSATPTYLIRSEKQLAALTAATRQEVVDVLEQLGTVSVGELAAALGRPADALYFHIRALTRAGLVRRSGYRPRPRGKEALYCTVAPELKLQYEPHRASNRKAVSAIVSSMLRLAMRDFRGAFRRDTVVCGPRRELWGLRKAGRLSQTGLAEVNRLIEELAKAVSAPRKRGRLYAITVVLTPLDHRNKIESSGKRKTRTK
jgi:DNA-binding transcriptional ArsR family regulator